MKAKSVVMTGALAGVGLIAAYATWQRPKDSGSSAATVKVLDASKQSLESVKFEDGPRFLAVKRVDGDLWVTTGYIPGKEPDAGVVDAGLLADGGLEQRPQEFDALPFPTREMKANERAQTSLEKFMPLNATRALGVLSDEKLAELGLAGSDRRLELIVSATARVFKVAKSLPGIMGTYLLEERTGEVFLLPGALLSDFDPQSQVLVDRRLHAFRQSEFDAFTVTADSKTASFVQTGIENPNTAKVARSATPEKPDELVKNWHDKIWSHLIVTEVLGKGELPKGKAPIVDVRVEYSLKGSKKGFLELATGEAGSTWARSENTASWVGIHQGSDEMVIEAKKLVVE